MIERRNQQRLFIPPNIGTLVVLTPPAGAASGDILSESFEGTGYENSWTELVGNGSVDEDSTAVTPPSGGGDQVLEIISAPTDFDARARWNQGSGSATTYVTVYVYIAAEGLGNQTQFQLAAGKTSGFARIWDFRLAKQLDGDVVLRCVMNDDSDPITDYPASGSINLDQWYRLDVKYINGTKAWEYRVDETPVGSGTLTTAAGEMQYVELGSNGDDYAMTFYVDLVQISSTGYVA